MSTYIRAVVAAMAIAEKYGIPLGDLVDTFADIPAADVARCSTDDGSKRMAYRFAQNAAKSMNGKITERRTAIPAARKWPRRR